METQYEVLNPWADVDLAPLKTPAPRLAGLEGKTIGLFCNNKEASLSILENVKVKLQERYPAISFIRYRLSSGDLEETENDPEARRSFELWLKKVDAVFAALGHCGPSSKSLVGTMIHAEQMGKPGVALCNMRYQKDAVSRASLEMPGIRHVLADIQPMRSIEEQLTGMTDRIVADVVTALTEPLSGEALAPESPGTEKQPRIVFRGTLSETHHFFYKKGWGDGLPIIPPTEAAVREMLTGTDLAPDHVVATITPRGGKATVEKIAVNAVMAGALPTHMPFLIAGVQALMTRKAYFSIPQVSTAGYSPMWIVNGPISRDLCITSGPGALSPGDLSHAAIGRAMGLIIKNIGGVRKGVEDHAVFGNPGRWSMVIAEDETGSPWDPLHVTHGFDRDDSTVTVFFPNSMSTLWPLGKDARGILEGVIYNASPSLGGLFCLMLPRAHAETLADGNWSKEQIARYIAQYARVPANRHPLYRGGVTVDSDKYRPPLSPEDPVPIWHTPDWIRVVVAGGPGNTMALFYGGFQGGDDHDFVTVKIELPENWNRLVDRYKDVMPRYETY